MDTTQQNQTQDTAQGPYEPQGNKKPAKIKTQFQIWFVYYFNAPFSWSRWTDISVFQYQGTCYLLQGKVNKFNNAKKFRVTGIKNKYGLNGDASITMEKLDACGLVNQVVQYNSK